MRVGLPNALVRQGACAWRLTGATRPDSFLDYSGLTPIDPAPDAGDRIVFADDQVQIPD